MKLIELLKVIDEQELIMIYLEDGSGYVHNYIRDIKLMDDNLLNSKVLKIEKSDLDRCIIDIMVDY